MENFMKTVRELNEVLNANNMSIVESRGLVHLIDRETKVKTELRSLFRALGREEAEKGEE